ncbi:hypothetical protein DSL72_006300 [Monilinia vaccinii-corymbosi]|uniref:DUF7025 domain-containing protein n=1 Tax=Monilinia vaccinii-corymbosi TaxID=61207 RepID=A0A8A3PN41_9HELO|nr:hypothetical protein DSL72_006300 [Monilinia vaccinii-corymbosi]
MKTLLDVQAFTEDDLLAQFKILYEVLSENVGNLFERIDVLLANQSITYDWLWAIFKYNDIISGPDSYIELVALRALKCEHQIGENRHFLLNCKDIDTNGTAFGLVSTPYEIMPFEGIRQIKDLNCVPKAILPPDKCDDLLKEGSTWDSAKNRLVPGVFLQTLELYAGIFFITMNHETAIDEAIRSRLHVKIQVPELERDRRRILWQSSLVQNKAEKIFEDGLGVRCFEILD